MTGATNPDASSPTASPTETSTNETGGSLSDRTIDDNPLTGATSPGTDFSQTDVGQSIEANSVNKRSNGPTAAELHAAEPDVGSGVEDRRTSPGPQEDFDAEFGQYSGQAQSFEKGWLDDHPNYDAGDVDVSRQGDHLVLQLTDAGERQRAQNIESDWLASHPTFGPEDVTVRQYDANGDGQDEFHLTLTAAGRQQIRERNQAQAQRQKPIGGAAEAVAAERSGQGARSTIVSPVTLDSGGGRMRPAGPINQRTANAIGRDIVRTKVDRKIDEQFGVDMVRGRDYIISDDSVRLTDAGKRRAATHPQETFWDPTFIIPEEVAGHDVPNGGKSVEEVLRGTAYDLNKWAEDTAGYREGMTPASRAGLERDQSDFGKGIQSSATDVATGALRTPALSVQAAIGAKEIGGWITEGATSQNRSEYWSLTAGEGISRAEKVKDYVWNHPYQFAGESVGTLVGTGVLMGSAASVSPSLGLATRLAIQPGEELLGYGGHAATRALAGEREASLLFPNNEPLIFSEEAAAWGIRSAYGKLRGADFDGLRSDISEASSLSRSWSPGFEVSFESRAPGQFPFTIDESVKTRARQRLSKARPSFEFDISSSETPGLGTAEIQSKVASEAKRAISKGRQTLTKTELQAEDFGYRLKQRTRTGVDRLRTLDLSTETPGLGRADLEARTATELSRFFGGGSEGPLLGTAELEARTASELGSVVRKPTEWSFDIGSRAESVKSTVGGRSSEFFETQGQRLTLASLRAEDLGFRAGVRTRQAADRLAAVDARDVLAGAGTAALSPIATGRQQLTKAELLAEDFGYHAGVATSNALGLSLEAPVFDISSAARREMTAARFRLSEASASARGTASDLRRTRIRIGGPARGETLFDTSWDEPPIRSHIDNPLGLDLSEVDVESSGGESSPAVDTSIESDVEAGGGQQLRIRSESVSTGAETGTGVDVMNPSYGGPRFELSLSPAGQSVDFETPVVGAIDRAQASTSPQADIGSQGVGELTNLDIAEAALSDQAIEPVGLEMLDQELAGSEVDVGLEVGTELAAETDIATEFEWELDLTHENEFEFESEPPMNKDEEMQHFGEPYDVGGSDTGPDSSFLSAGWFNEYVTAVGIGAGPRELAPASTRGAEESVYLEQRPTKAQVSGKKATRERISAAEDLFNFEEFGDSSESDDWEWFL